MTTIDVRRDGPVERVTLNRPDVRNALNDELIAELTEWAASIRDYMSCETVTGEGGWMDQVLMLDGPYIKDGFIQVTSKPGLGITLNPDVVKAHLVAGETYWG